MFYFILWFFFIFEFLWSKMVLIVLNFKKVLSWSWLYIYIYIYIYDWFLLRTTLSFKNSKELNVTIFFSEIFLHMCNKSIRCVKKYCNFLYITYTYVLHMCKKISEKKIVTLSSFEFLNLKVILKRNQSYIFFFLNHQQTKVTKFNYSR